MGDGWETRRSRGKNFDWLIIKCAAAARVNKIQIDTHHFKGNYPDQCSIQASLIKGKPSAKKIVAISKKWKQLLNKVKLKAHKKHNFRNKLMKKSKINHIRINIFPDGGIARLRVYGDPHPDWSGIDMSQILEVSSIDSGGRIAGYNDAHYGMPWVILTSGRGKNMGDGWETRRRREPGHDWILVRLGATAEIEKVEVDTAHFKGNYPYRCSLQASMAGNETDEELAAKAEKWSELLSPQKLSMDQQHFFQKHQLQDLGPVNCVRLNIFPDGGISRLRIFGRPQF